MPRQPEEPRCPCGQQLWAPDSIARGHCEHCRLHHCGHWPAVTGRVRDISPGWDTVAYREHREQLLAAAYAPTTRPLDHSETVEQFKRLERPDVHPMPTCPRCGSRVQHHTVTLCQRCRDANP